MYSGKRISIVSKKQHVSKLTSGQLSSCD
uniref:Uncharacterized protein n=1 Tax=Rhizophora mucronata TaxID=61149 RepID=A0A2P2Q5L4_RHIMU